MKKEIIKKWLEDHDINLPEERIDILVKMLENEEKERVAKVYKKFRNLTI